MPTPTSKFSYTDSVLNNCGIWNERQMPSRVIWRGSEAGDIAILIHDVTRIGLEIAGDHVDEGGLAGAVAADQPDHAVLLDTRVDVRWPR